MYILLAVGMTFVLLTGGIDVSVGGTLGLAAAVSATMIRDGGSILMAIIVAMVIGLSIGFINGVGISIVKVPAIIMTLGSLGIVRVLMIIYTDGKWVENLPNGFKMASQVNIGPMNLYFLGVLLIVFLVQMYFSRARTGKYFAAIGDNVEGAVLVGIPAKKFTVLAYVISGFCASIAGVVFASQVGFVTSNSGLDIEMTAIASCVLGGVSLSGGIGSVVGASIGALIMTAINSALIFLKVPSFWNKSIQGTLLILIVVSDVLIHKYFEEKARRERLTARASNLETDKHETQLPADRTFLVEGDQK